MKKRTDAFITLRQKYTAVNHTGEMYSAAIARERDNRLVYKAEISTAWPIDCEWQLRKRTSSQNMPSKWFLIYINNPIECCGAFGSLCFC